MKTLKRTLWLMAFCAVALFGVNEAKAVSSGAEARVLLEESAALIEQQGFVEQAQRVREQVAILSDDELLEAYESIDLEALVLAQADAADASERAFASVKKAEADRRRAASARSISTGGDAGKTLQSGSIEVLNWDDVLGTGNGSVHPGQARGVRSDTPSNIVHWITIRALRTALQLSFSGLQIARDAFNICDAAAGQAVVAGGIGVCAGGNAAAACIPVAITVTVLQSLFTIADSELNYEIARRESTDYLDYRIDSAELGLIQRRAAYLNEQLLALDQNLVDYDESIRAQLQLHDDDIKNQLQLHDDDIKHQLDVHDQDIKVWLLRLQAKANLALKTQLQNMMTNNGGARALMSYTERLEEVCRLAEESITNATNAGYKVHFRAQQALDRGMALKDSDPKKAHDECRDAFQYAVSRSPHRLPGYGGRR
jgi:hypothetical protein